MKKNSKNLSVQSQVSQQHEEQQATPLSTLTMNELESVCAAARSNPITVGERFFDA